jgi:hypothetical protein
MRIPPKSEYVREWHAAGEVWTVRLVKRMPKGFKGCYAICIESQRTILIRESLSELESWSAFIHEYVHMKYSDLPEAMVHKLEMVFLELWVSI